MSEIDRYLKPGAIVPISVHMTGLLMHEVIGLRAALDIARSALLRIERQAEECRALMTSNVDCKTTQTETGE